MNAIFRLVLGLAALIPAGSVLADDGTLRVAVSVDMTSEGRHFAGPTAEKPVYYLPVVSGYKERGAILTYYQGALPPSAQVENQIAKALADQGYRLASQPSDASVVLDFQWGYVAPYIAPAPRRFGAFDFHPAAGLHSRNWVTNWDEMGTYVIGEKWPDLSIEARRHQADPQTQEIFDSIREAANDPTGGAQGRGARYYLLVSALDSRAFLQHQPVLLWRVHASTPYWGHTIDEVLPTLIDTAALTSDRETQRIEVITVPIAGWQPMDKGATELSASRVATSTCKS